MLSGRHTILFATPGLQAVNAIKWCCRRMGRKYTGAERLVYESEVLPQAAMVMYWPGIRPRGEITEYTLILSELDETTAG
eukprot:869264-Amphidinium_carterae.1